MGVGTAPKDKYSTKLKSSKLNYPLKPPKSDTSGESSFKHGRINNSFKPGKPANPDTKSGLKATGLKGSNVVGGKVQAQRQSGNNLGKSISKKELKVGLDDSEALDYLEYQDFTRTMHTNPVNS